MGMLPSRYAPGVVCRRYSPQVSTEVPGPVEPRSRNLTAVHVSANSASVNSFSPLPTKGQPLGQPCAQNPGSGLLKAFPKEHRLEVRTSGKVPAFSLVCLGCIPPKMSKYCDDSVHFAVGKEEELVTSTQPLLSSQPYLCKALGGCEPGPHTVGESLAGEVAVVAPVAMSCMERCWPGRGIRPS